VASFHTHSSFAAQFSTAVLCFHRHSRVGRSFLELLSSFSVSPKRHLVSACWACQRSCQLRFPSHGLRGKRRPKRTRPNPCSLFSIPCSLFPVPYSLPLPFRLLNPESRILTPIAYYPSLSAAACQETQSRFPLSGLNLPPADAPERSFPGPPRGVLRIRLDAKSRTSCCWARGSLPT
jgi:hypothetical protein